MRALTMLLRGLLWLLLAVVALVGAYAAYAHWAWRDLPVEQLDTRYGGPELRHATLDGVPIRYRLEGNDGPLVVLIHSHYFDMGIWDAWAPALLDRYRVLRYDLSGHGLTGPDPSGVYSVARDVKLLDALLDHVELRAAALVGSSLGGNIAFTAAAAQPDGLQALALMNSGGLKRDDARHRGEIPGWADHVMPLIPPRALEAFLSWMVVDSPAVTAAYATRFVDLWRRSGNRRAELARLRQFDIGEPDPLLAAIQVPVLIQWGEANPQLPVALAARFEASLSAAPRVERHTYPGVGHVLPLERPAAVAELRRFLDRELGDDGAAR